MYQVNLIKGWHKVESYKEYKNKLSILFVVGIVVFLAIYIFLLINLYFKQQELTNLKEEGLYQSQLQYPVDKITKAVYGQKKLDQIKEIVLEYPEYYKIHNYLIKKILNQPEIEITDYNIQKGQSVDITLNANSLNHIFSLLNTLQEEQVVKNFVQLNIKGIKLMEADDTNEKTFIVDLNLEFSPSFVNDQT